MCSVVETDASASTEGNRQDRHHRLPPLNHACWQDDRRDQDCCRLLLPRRLGYNNNNNNPFADPSPSTCTPIHSLRPLVHALCRPHAQRIKQTKRQRHGSSLVVRGAASRMFCAWCWFSVQAILSGGAAWALDTVISTRFSIHARANFLADHHIALGRLGRHRMLQASTGLGSIIMKGLGNCLGETGML